jgi:hypothetical protein
VLVNRPSGSAEGRLTDFNLCLCQRTVKSLSFFVFENQLFSEPPRIAIAGCLKTILAPHSSGGLMERLNYPNINRGWT